MFRGYNIKNFNIRLVLLVLSLTIIGILVIGSANEQYQSRQVLGLVLGLCCMSVFAIIDYGFIIRFRIPIYLFTLGLLTLVLLFGEKVAGARRWIDFGVRFQPSELSKILLILFFAKVLDQCREDINRPRILALILGLMAIPLVLIMAEPDLSTTIVTFLMMAAMLFYSGLSYKIIAPVVGAMAVFSGIIIYSVLSGGEGILHSYQSDRIQGWLRPEEYPQISYQQQNSIMAIGSGQFLGKGLYNTDIESVKNGNYISEGQTDFVFAIIGEELGFIGAAIIIIIMFLLSLECILMAKKAKDFSGELICVGMGSLIFIQSFVNIGVVTGLLPNTGLTLPFISYGLTSLVTLFMGIGIVANISLQSKQFHRGD